MPISLAAEISIGRRTSQTDGMLLMSVGGRLSRSVLYCTRYQTAAPATLEDPRLPDFSHRLPHLAQTIRADRPMGSFTMRTSPFKSSAWGYEWNGTCSDVKESDEVAILMMKELTNERMYRNTT